MTLKRRSGLCLTLVNETRGRTADVCWLYVHCDHCVKGKNVHTELKQHGADCPIIFIKTPKGLNIPCRLIESWFKSIAQFHREQRGIILYQTTSIAWDDVSHKPVWL